MQLQRDNSTRYRIEAYSPEAVQIEGETYTSSLIVSSDGVLPDWSVGNPPTFNEACIKSLFALSPDVLIIGYEDPHHAACMAFQKQLIRQNISVEILSFGAACRTYNVLLSEARHVVLGLVLR